MPQRIFYGVAGEGLGHASRVLATIGHLPDVEVHVFTFGKAYQFFAEMHYPHLHEIDGLMFAYRNGKVNYLRTGARSARYSISGMRQNIQSICTEAKLLEPDLCITDFEPSVIRAAHRRKLPVLSIDNQHKFVHCSSETLPRFLRYYTRMTGWAVRRMIPHPTHTVIATFHADCLKKERPDVTLTSGILRKEVEQHAVANDGYLLLYLRESIGEKTLAALVGCQREVRVFGATSEQQQRYAGEFDFHPLSPEFVDHLAACDRIISTAGNQLISECRFLGKPILAIPEPGQYEQHVNAHFVERIGMGQQCDLGELSSERIGRFLEDDSFRFEPMPNGIHDVVRVIDSYLPVQKNKPVSNQYVTPVEHRLESLQLEPG